MGGEGSMAGANISLKMNRKGLPSKRGGYRSNYDGKTLSSKEFVSKKVSPEKLAILKTQIREKARKERRNKTLIFIGCMLVLSSLFWLLI
ncbi:MAG: hypothetical protein HUJ25_15380 [Crocinitomicaceae bacterium]|nr:hypothetical protein [Crocinitomicaceae bacterium]